MYNRRYKLYKNEYFKRNELKSGQIIISYNYYPDLSKAAFISIKNNSESSLHNPFLLRYFL
jgi:hypothetical protein